MSIPASALLGAAPWLITSTTLDQLRAELDPAESASWACVGERLPPVADVLAASPSLGDADVVLLASSPSQLATIDELDLRDGAQIVVPDVRVPGLTAIGDVEIGSHVFHRYHAPAGTRRAHFDEEHLLAIMHPQYDGFVVATLLAHGPLLTPTIVASEALAAVITPHHRLGPLGRGQVRPIDLELHPGVIPPTGITGVLEVHEDGQPTGVTMHMTVATTPGIDCVLAGRTEGPLAADRFDELIAAISSGSIPARKAVRAITGDVRRGWRWWNP